MQTHKLLFLCLYLPCAIAFGQLPGTFRNLDFESANLMPIPAGQGGGLVPINDALPFWTGYLGTNQRTQVLQNNLTLGTANISILGPNWSFGGIIEGQYTVVLQPGQNPVSGIPGDFVDASIAQFGGLPGDSQSIRMKVNGSLQYFALSFEGQDISLLTLGSGPNYTFYAGDVSHFAGQTGNLRITGLTTQNRPDNALFFDSIVFSPEPVPEPGSLALFAAGLILLGVRWRYRRR